MANMNPPEENFITTENAKEYQMKSAKARSENVAKRKTLREELLALLEKGDTQEKMSLAQIQKALQGDTKAFETIRDTIGEKPVEKVAGAVGNTIEEALKRVDGDEY